MKKVLLLCLTSVVFAGCGLTEKTVIGVVDVPVVVEKSEFVKSSRKGFDEHIKKINAAKPGSEEQRKLMVDFEKLQSDMYKKTDEKLKAAMDEVMKENKLSAIAIKTAVPVGGVDVTDKVISKMK